MRRTLLLRTAATLALVTGVAHTIATFMPVPAEQTQMLTTVAIMSATLVPMPVGAARSFMQILDGNNLCTSLLLALCAALLFAVAGAPKERTADRVVTITALALAGASIISARYFFPVPALFTAVAAGLALLGRSRP